MSEIVTITLTNHTLERAGPNEKRGLAVGDRWIVPPVKDRVQIPPGTPFETDAEGAAKMLRKFPGEIVSENAPQLVVDAKADFDREKAATVEAVRPNEQIGGPTRPFGLRNW